MIAQTPSSLPSVSGGGGAVDHVEISPRLRLESDAGCLNFGGAAVFHLRRAGAGVASMAWGVAPSSKRRRGDGVMRSRTLA